jgi:endonuclease/exonuclease/phosphatase family metal-dependent hydrolase
VKIISWNLLHSIGATLEEVVHLVERERPDLFLMQEATAAMDHLPARIGGHYARNPLPGRLHGLAAWSPLPFAQTPHQIALQPGLFVKRISQIVALEDFAVANVHLSHGQLMNRRQLRLIAHYLPPRAIIIGDCNMVGPSLLRGFRDVGERNATHDMGEMLPLRLDRCFLRGITCTQAEILGRAGSDHRPIAVWVEVPLEGRLKPIRDEFAKLAQPGGLPADNAFFDELSGEP